MNIVRGILYGILQGITEFLPVSSSGHLAVLHAMLGDVGDTSAAFDVMLHIATLLAVCAVYGKEIMSVIKGFFTLMKKAFSGRLKEGLDSNEKLFVMLFVASVSLIPAAFLDGYVESVRSKLWLIGALLIINGAIMFIGDRMAEGTLDIASLGYKNAFAVGVVQLFAILPGISRSGSTTVAAMSAGMKRDESVRFSFLISVPAVMGAAAVKLPELFSGTVTKAELLPLLAGSLSAFFVGIAAIKLLEYVAGKKRFNIFGVYCITVGLTAIVYDVLK